MGRKSKYQPYAEMRWGRLECKGEICKREWQWNGAVREEIDNYYLQFKCDCGRAYEIPSENWKGKQSAKDCGECDLAYFVAPQSNVSFLVPSPVLVKMKKHTKALNLGMSQWIRDLINREIEK